jgi:hypothetical protein
MEEQIALTGCVADNLRFLNVGLPITCSVSHCVIKQLCSSWVQDYSHQGYDSK